MRLIMVLSDLMIPLMFASILMYGISRRVPVYDTFIDGAKDGFKTVLGIMPTIIGDIVSKKMFRITLENRA